MNYEIFELPTKSLAACAEKSSVTALHAQGDGTLLCGLAFARPALFRVFLSADGQRVERFEDLSLETRAGDALLGVVGGLRPSTSGDTVFSLLHTGFLPGWLRGLLGAKLQKLSGAALLEFLMKQDGGMGAFLRHSIVQISEKEMSLRRYKEPGMLLDVAHIGDFIFGLTPSAIWREPYLNSEKRETMRADLRGNGELHRDDSGTFWLANEAARVLRLGQTEIKARPTPLKLADASLTLSTASATDGWLYAVTGGGKELVRIRRNPVSLEEELQKIATFPYPITGLLALEDETSSKVVIALDTGSGTELKSVVTLRAEDPELLPAIPVPQSEGTLVDMRGVSSLTRVVGSRNVWAGESRLIPGAQGASLEKSRLVRISGL